jgi:DamX protein
MSQLQNNNALIQQLTKHFNLESELFSEKSGFFFEGAQRQHNLETLRHLASFGDMVLFLTGDKGAGKTTLLRKLVTSSFEGLNVWHLDCERLVQEGQGRSTYILKACLQLLGLDTKEDDSSRLLTILLTECHRLVASDGVRTLFAFDNADKLPKKELQAYCSFCKELSPESALVMLFVGSNGLIQSSKLASDLELDVWWHQIQLKPLSQTEVLPYLERALVLAGCSVKLELTDVQIQQISELGKGLPSRINKLFPSVVLEPGLLKIKAKSNSRGAPIWIMFGLAGLLVISFIFVSYQHGLFDRIVPVFSLDDELVSAKLDKDVSPVVPDVDLGLIDERSLQQKARLAMLDTVMKEKGISIPLAKESEKIIQNPSPLKLSLNETKQNVLDKAIEDDLAKSLEQGTFDLPEQALNKGEQENDVDLSGREDEVLIDKEVRDSKINTKLVENLKEKEILKPYTVTKYEDRSLDFKSKAWLKGQSESSYLAQILGSYSEETAVNFIRKIGKQKFEVFYLQTEHKGKSWYVVFYGIFPAKRHAQDAVKNAPKIIRSQNPWIRRSTEVLASYPN